MSESSEVVVAIVVLVGARPLPLASRIRYRALARVLEAARLLARTRLRRCLRPGARGAPPCPATCRGVVLRPQSWAVLRGLVARAPLVEKQCSRDSAPYAAIERRHVVWRRREAFCGRCSCSAPLPREWHSRPGRGGGRNRRRGAVSRTCTIFTRNQYHAKGQRRDVDVPSSAQQCWRPRRADVPVRWAVAPAVTRSTRSRSSRRPAWLNTPGRRSLHDTTIQQMKDGWLPSKNAIVISNLRVAAGQWFDPV